MYSFITSVFADDQYVDHFLTIFFQVSDHEIFNFLYANSFILYLFRGFAVKQHKYCLIKILSAPKKWCQCRFNVRKNYFFLVFSKIRLRYLAFLLTYLFVFLFFLCRRKIFISTSNTFAKVLNINIKEISTLSYII